MGYGIFALQVDTNDMVNKIVNSIFLMRYTSKLNPGQQRIHERCVMSEGLYG